MRERAPTVFLVVHQGFIARFLLRTEILSALKDAGCRVVVLAPEGAHASLQEEFADEQVVIEGLRQPPKRGGERSLLWWWTLHLRNYAIANGHRTRALREKAERFPERFMEGQPVEQRVFKVAIHALWRSRRLRRALLRLELDRYVEEAHRDLFERYRPDIVVTTSPGYFKPDARLLREAAIHGVPSASVILSWDNPTSKGYRGANPDLVLTWSERMSAQMVEFQDFAPEQLVVAGVPHFDAYYRDDELPSREALFARLGLDPARRLILFATSAPGYYGRDHEVAEQLARAVAGDALGAPAQLVIRVHPNFPSKDVPIKDFERVAQAYPHVRLDVPEILPAGLSCHMPGSDSERLMALVRHCDVLVNVFSTTTLEAFAVDRPVVMIASKALVYEHMAEVLESGAAPVASDEAQLIGHVRRYLEHPEHQRAERAAIAARELGPADGAAGRRIAGLLLELAGQPAPAPAPVVRA
jgi:hypothetical protein